jgi:hypothetical protein
MNKFKVYLTFVSLEFSHSNYNIIGGGLKKKTKNKNRFEFI